MLRRMGRQYTIEHYLERLDRIRAAVPGISLSTDVIVGFCGETEAEYEATLDLLRTVRFDQVFAAAYSERPGTPATKLADDVPAIEKRRRLVGLLGVQEAIGLERNLAWLGRTTEVLVDTIVPPRTHDHDEDAAETEDDGAAASRDAFVRLPEGLVHLVRAVPREQARPRRGAPALLGEPVEVRIEHAGAYALRGSPVRRSATDGVRRPLARRDGIRRLATPGGGLCAIADAHPPLAPLIVIGGPTATGKTGLAIALAERLLARGIPAEVVSADSRQVYRGLDIGTAKATPDERARVVHHGLDLVDADQPYSVADFRPHALSALEALGARGGIGILAGGTGFWLRAVFAGIDTDALPSDQAVRRALEADLARDGLDALAERLAALAPDLASATDLRNPRRVVRAPEIATLQGDAPLPRPVGYPAPVLGFQLGLDAVEHRRRIAVRARAVRRRPGGGGPCPAGPLRSEPAGVLGHRVPGELGGPRRRAGPRDRDRAGRVAQRGLRQAPAHVVPARALAPAGGRGRRPVNGRSSNPSTRSSAVSVELRDARNAAGMLGAP